MNEKIELMKSASMVADFWGETTSSLLCMTAMLKKEKKEEWNKIAKEVVAFYEAPIQERIKLMGLDMGIEIVKEEKL